MSGGNGLSNKKRVSSYDGLKGLSILAIISYHLFKEKIPGGFVSGGFLMVNTFFAIAGYFFTYKIEKINVNRQTKDWLAIVHYVKRTIGRLFFPLLWMIGWLVIGYLIISPKTLNYLRSELFSGIFFYNNLYQISADRSYFVQMTEASPLTHLWYNSLYLQSFIIALGVVILTKYLNIRGQFKAMLWALISIISHFLLLFLYIPGEDPSRVYYGLDTRFSSFAIGIMMAYMIPAILNQFYRVSFKKELYSLIGLVAFTSLIGLLFVAQDQDPETYYFLMPLYSVISMGVIFAITVGVPLVRLPLSFKPLVWVGKRSYSYYLWYYPIITFWMQYNRQLEEMKHWLALAIIITLVMMSEISYQLIEKGRLPIPFLKGFEWKQNWHQFNRNNHPLIFPILGIIFLVIVGYGMAIARDDIPLNRFKLEYQLAQTKQQVQNFIHPLEPALKRTKEKLVAWDEQLNTYLHQEIPQIDFVQEIQTAYRYSDEASAGLGALINENQIILQTVMENNPDMASLLTPEVQLFAAETPVSFFGDSLILLSAPKSLALFLNSNYWGKESLQLWDAVGYLSDWIDTGEVNDILVVNLGTNAGLDDEGMESLISVAGNRKIFFVNSNSDVAHKFSVNELIYEYANRYDNVYEIDWYNYSKEHPEYYWEGEGIHHSPEGVNHFAAFVAQNIYDVIKR